jgi:integrase
MRPSEALALSWGDVNINRQRISISKSRYLDLKPLRKPQPANARSKSLGDILIISYCGVL